MPFVGEVMLIPVKEASSLGRTTWSTAADVIFRSERYAEVVVSIPKGFATDLASVPRFLPFASMIAADTAVKAALVHDYLYHNGGWAYVAGSKGHVSRRTADGILHEIMESEGTPRWRAWVIWAAVRIAGFSAYGRGILLAVVLASSLPACWTVPGNVRAQGGRARSETLREMTALRDLERRQQMVRKAASGQLLDRARYKLFLDSWDLQWIYYYAAMVALGEGRFEEAANYITLANRELDLLLVLLGLAL